MNFGMQGLLYGTDDPHRLLRGLGSLMRKINPKNRHSRFVKFSYHVFVDTDRSEGGDNSRHGMMLK